MKCQYQTHFLRRIKTPTEFRIHLDSFIRVFQCLRERHQFHVRCCTVVVTSCISRVPLDTLTVVLDCSCEVTRLELDVTIFPSNSALFGIDVCLAVLLGLQAFKIAQFVENVRCAVFRKGFLIVLDGGLEVSLFLIGETDTTKSLSDQFVVGAQLSTKLRK